ncbi:MAG: hypothetical protein AAGH83_02565 [Pseudomonadota bacterium]
MTLKSPHQSENDLVNSSWISRASILAVLTIVVILTAAVVGT